MDAAAAMNSEKPNFVLLPSYKIFNMLSLIGFFFFLIQLLNLMEAFLKKYWNMTTLSHLGDSLAVCGQDCLPGIDLNHLYFSPLCY